VVKVYRKPSEDSGREFDIFQALQKITITLPKIDENWPSTFLLLKIPNNFEFIFLTFRGHINSGLVSF